MPSLLEEEVKGSAATAGVGIGMLMYPAVAGAFAAAGTPALAIAGITCVIAAGIAGCSYGAVSAMYRVSELVTDRNDSKEKNELNKKAKDIGNSLIVSDSLVVASRSGTDKGKWVQTATNSRSSEPKSILAR